MRIAIVKLSALGDIVHAMTVLQFIKRAFPQSRIDWVVEEQFTGLLQHNPDIDTVLPVKLKALKLQKSRLFSEIARVRGYAQNGYDIVIDMQGLIKSAVVSKMLGTNAGFDRNSIRERVAALFYRRSFAIPYERNVILRNLDLVASALEMQVEETALESKAPFLYFTEKDREKIAAFLKEDTKNIVYILGSSWQSKVYPKEKFVEVIRALGGNPLLVWGSDAERETAQYIAEKCTATLLPALDLNALKALIFSADLVIGGDSGPTHFAWALNRPSITIFGPTPSARNVLETPINRVVDCQKEIDPSNLDRHDPCIRKILPEQIITLARDLL